MALFEFGTYLTLVCMHSWITGRTAFSNPIYENPALEENDDDDGYHELPFQICNNMSVSNPLYNKHVCQSEHGIANPMYQSTGEAIMDPDNGYDFPNGSDGDLLATNLYDVVTYRDDDKDTYDSYPYTEDLHEPGYIDFTHLEDSEETHS